MLVIQRASNRASEASIFAPMSEGSSDSTRIESDPTTVWPLNATRLSLPMPGKRALVEPMLPCSSAIAMHSVSDM